MKKTSFFAGSLLVLLFTNGANAAPRQLLNKSVVIGWSEAIVEKGEDGRVINTQASRERIAYISSAGRVFVRANTRVTGGQKTEDVVPGSGQGMLSFQGNNLVGY